MYYFDFFYADRHIHKKKLKENLLILDAVIPKARKK